MADVEDVIRYAQLKKTDYFFIEESDLARNPIVEPWLWGDVKDPSLELLKHVPLELADEYYPAAWYQFLKSKSGAATGSDQIPKKPEAPNQNQTPMQ